MVAKQAPAAPVSHWRRPALARGSMSAMLGIMRA
jgi:hypothetical protein